MGFIDGLKLFCSSFFMLRDDDDCAGFVADFLLDDLLHDVRLMCGKAVSGNLVFLIILRICHSEQHVIALYIGIAVQHRKLFNGHALKEHAPDERTMRATEEVVFKRHVAGGLCVSKIETNAQLLIIGEHVVILSAPAHAGIDDGIVSEEDVFIDLLLLDFRIDIQIDTAAAAVDDIAVCLNALAGHGGVSFVDDDGNALVFTVMNIIVSGSQIIAEKENTAAGNTHAVLVKVRLLIALHTAAEPADFAILHDGVLCACCIETGIDIAAQMQLIGGAFAFGGGGYAFVQHGNLNFVVYFAGIACVAAQIERSLDLGINGEILTGFLLEIQFYEKHEIGIQTGVKIKFAAVCVYKALSVPPGIYLLGSPFSTVEKDYAAGRHFILIAPDFCAVFGFSMQRPVFWIFRVHHW